MARTPREVYDKSLSTLENTVENGDVTKEDAEAIRQLCYAFDPEDARESLPSADELYGKGRGPKGKGKHKKYRTLGAWCERLTALAQGVELTDDDGNVTGHVEGVELTATDTTADDVNRFTTELKKADNGASTSYIRNIEYAAGKFYRFHSDLGVDPDRITVHEYDSNSGNGWDERDLLDADERAALRAVCRNARDRAILHMLLYCGLRNTALRTLRVKDVQPGDNEWYFNTTADGLKNIDRPTEPRPLFQAERAVRDWLHDHPDPDPNHYFITGLPRASKKDPTKPMTAETIRYTMQTLKERTAERDDMKTVKKPCHPHMMRHNFVSMCRKHPDITDADIKFYIGHSPDSDVMETTYSHLSSDDHNERGKAAFGTHDAGTDSDNTPPWDTTCRRCDRVLSPGDDKCDECGTPRESTPWDQGHPEGSDTEFVTKDELKEVLAAAVQVDRHGGPAQTDDDAVAEIVSELRREAQGNVQPGTDGQQTPVNRLLNDDNGG